VIDELLVRSFEPSFAVFMWILSSFVERDLPTETGYSTVVSRSSARALHPRRGCPWWVAVIFDG